MRDALRDILEDGSGVAASINEESAKTVIELRNTIERVSSKALPNIKNTNQILNFKDNEQSSV